MKQMDKKQLEALWKFTVELNNTLGLNASIMDDVYDKIHQYARKNGIDIEELDIEY